eukprot:3935540-Rhodomonas_salina.2
MPGTEITNGGCAASDGGGARQVLAAPLSSYALASQCPCGTELAYAPRSIAVVAPCECGTELAYAQLAYGARASA